MTDHQPRQRLEEQSLQSVALADDPVIVEARQELPPIALHRRPQAGSIIPDSHALERLYVEPEVSLRIELYRVGITQEQRLVVKAASDVPEGRGE
jgi:hypothetical protein